MINQITNGIEIGKAAAKAHVPAWKVEELARRQLIFSPKTTNGPRLVSADVVADLQRLCTEHFDRDGVFLANGVVIADYHARNVDGVGAVRVREVM